MLDFVRRQDQHFSLQEQEVLRSLDCETNILTPKRLCKKFETARCSEPLKKRDCETFEFCLKFCEILIF